MSNLNDVDRATWNDKSTVSKQDVDDSAADIEKIEIERQFREREIRVKEKECLYNEHKVQLQRDELSIRIKDHQRNRFTNPLFVALITGAFAIGLNAFGLLWNARFQRDLEDYKAEAARILEALKAKDPDASAENLSFLLSTGLIADAERAEKIKLYLRNRKPGQGANVPPGPEVTGSSYGVQIGIRGTEQEALEAIKAFHEKYMAFSAEPFTVSPAEINGKQLFRLRLGPYTRLEASTTCRKLIEAGGMCFVAKYRDNSEESFLRSPSLETVEVPLPPTRPQIP